MRKLSNFIILFYSEVKIPKMSSVKKKEKSENKYKRTISYHILWYMNQKYSNE